MAKRFTDSNKWNDPFYLDMPMNFKLAYSYILDLCDAVGVWVVNTRMAEFCIGEKIDWDAFKSYMGDRLFIINNQKWWMVKFCSFQYGVLNSDSGSRPIKSHIKLLKKHNLWDMYLANINTDYEINNECSVENVPNVLTEIIPEEKIELPTPKKPVKKSLIADYPKNVKDAFKSYFSMRVGIKKKMTENAKQRLINKVEKLSGGIDDNKISLLNMAEDKNWLSVFPPNSYGKDNSVNENGRYNKLNW